MNPTPEEIAAVVRSSEIMAWMAARAAKCDHLEDRNKHLQENSDGIAARHGVLQSVIRKAVEGLGNAMPECRGMSLPELVIEAEGRIRKPESASSSTDAVSTALRIARHLLNDLERVELGQHLLSHLLPGENVDTGALRVLADEVERLQGDAKTLVVENDKLRTMNANASRLASQEATAKHYAEEQLTHLAKFIGLPGMTWANVVSEAVSLIERQKDGNARVLSSLKDCAAELDKARQERDAARADLKLSLELRTSLGASTRETIDRLHGEVLVMEDAKSSLMMEVDRLTIELAEARAENGAQAALISSMMKPVRIETPHTGRDDKALFRDWMESQPTDVLKPEPLRLEVGKTYVRRDGGRETIVRKVGGLYCFQTEDGRGYAESGQFGFFDIAHDEDLVALAPTVDPTSPHP